MQKLSKHPIDDESHSANFYECRFDIISGFFCFPIVIDILDHRGVVPDGGLIRYFDPPIHGIYKCAFRFTYDKHIQFSDIKNMIHNVFVEIYSPKRNTTTPYNYAALAIAKETIKKIIIHEHERKIEKIKNNMSELDKNKYKLTQLHSKEKSTEFLWNYITNKYEKIHTAPRISDEHASLHQ